ncbi:MAG: hypothetical protein AABY87_01515 [bacterium]
MIYDGRGAGRTHTKRSKGFFMGLSVLKSEDGMALVLVLILSVISLAFMASLIYMTTTVTQMSGAHKRYETAIEGGKAGIDVVRQLVNVRGNPNIPTINFAQTAAQSACLNSKLNNPTANWINCTANATSTLINDQDSTSYDMTFEMGVNPNPVYRIYAKIVDTVNGNSGGNMGLSTTGVVSSNSGQITPMNTPYLYTIEVLSENLANPVERARFSVLHEY